MSYTNLSMIEINLLNYCNRNCSFCPVDNTKQLSQLSINLLSKLLNELQENDYNGRIALSGFCEPMLHPEIDLIIESIKVILPDVTLVLCSNGDFLNKRKMNNLFELGLDSISLSKYEVYNKFIDEIKDDRVDIRDRIDTKFINNRAGAVKTNSNLPIDSNCFYPFYMLYIDWNGDIQFCPHDFNKQMVLGNLYKDRIKDIWSGENLNSIRNLLSNDKRNFSPCINCDVNGKVRGNKEYENWKEIHKTKYKSE